jgi:hypothetical protein
MTTHASIERQLRRLAHRQLDMIAGELVQRVSKSEWRLNAGEPLSLLVAVDKLAEAARKLEEGST